MVASDPHLSLGSPATFYEVGVDVDARRSERLTLYGVTFPGSPASCTARTATCPGARRSTRPTSRTSTRSNSSSPAACRSRPRTRATPSRRRSSRRPSGRTSPATARPTTSSSSRPRPAFPAATVVVPRRNNGPLISVSGTTGLSVQFTGFSATREIDFFRLLSHADDVERGDRRPAVLRLRRAELDVRRRQRQHRLQDERGDPAARGPPGRHGRRTAALLRPERDRRQRVDRRPDAGRGPGHPVRGAADSPRWTGS